MIGKLIDGMFNRIAAQMLKNTIFLKHRHGSGDHTHGDYMSIALQNQKDIAKLRQDLRDHVSHDYPIMVHKVQE